MSTANERTFLGFVRTAQAFSMTGIYVAQLMRLQHSPTPTKTIGFFAVGVPLSCICQIIAMIVTVIGAFRFFKIQNNLALNWAVSGGWEILAIGGLGTGVRLNSAMATND